MTEDEANGCVSFNIEGSKAGGRPPLILRSVATLAETRPAPLGGASSETCGHIPGRYKCASIPQRASRAPHCSETASSKAICGSRIDADQAAGRVFVELACGRNRGVGTQFDNDRSPQVPRPLSHLIVLSRPSVAADYQDIGARDAPAASADGQGAVQVSSSTYG